MIVLIVIAAAVIALLLAAWFVQRKRAGHDTSAESHASPGSKALSESVPGPPDTTDEYAGTVLALPTDRPNEVYLFGTAEQLDTYGSTLATAPPQLARYATGLRAGADAARNFAEMSGRLVLVDEKTAAAMRAGSMVRDAAGEVLAIAKRADGKFASVARLRQVGGIAASASSMTNALSAMALQAQLDRIERQLSAISDGIDSVNREQLREWHAQTLGAQDMLRQVYSTAAQAGELTSPNYDQIAGIGHVVRTQLNGDRDRLSAAVADLERLAAARDLKTRLKDIDAKVEAVQLAHAALTESTRSWAQYSALRLWQFTVIGEPALEAYRKELQVFIESSKKEIEPLRVRSSEAVGKLAQYRWTARVRHPVAAHRLPAASESRLMILSKVKWQPLELRAAEQGTGALRGQ